MNIYKMKQAVAMATKTLTQQHLHQHPLRNT